MQVHGTTNRNLVLTTRYIYSTEGVKAFYVSYPTTLTITVPFTAVQFTTYEWAKKLLNPSNQYSPLSHVTAGGFAGAVAAALTTPLDVCKTLLQTRGTSTDPAIRAASGIGQAFAIIKTRDGYKGFTRGLAPRVLTCMPSNALCWLVRLFSPLWLDLADELAKAGKGKIARNVNRYLMLTFLVL